MGVYRGLVAAPLAALLGMTAVPLAAQAPAGGNVAVAVGSKVIDTADGEVGTITALQGDNVIVKTDKHEVALPKTSFTPTPKGLLFGLTRDQLNAELDKALAAQGPLLAVGGTVYDPQGGVVGTIEQFDAEFATLKLATGQVKLPVAAFGRGPNGAMIGETAASLQAKVAAAAR